MRYKKHSLIITTGTLATLLLLASCTQDFLSGSDTGNRPAMLNLTTLQASGINATTRAAATSDYPADRLIGFFVKADAPNEYDACSNYKGAYDATLAKWLPAPDILLNSHDADIAVYAPYDITQTAPAALSLTACLRPADGSKDIWCKRFIANNRSGSLSITLEHLYTRLSLTLTRDANYKVEAVLTDISLTGNEIYAGSTYRFFEDAPYAYDKAKGFSALSMQVLSDASPTAQYDMLLIPTALLTDNITLAFTVNGKKMQAIILKEKFAATAGKLEAGKQYNINLKLIPGKLEITSVSVENWNTGTAQSGDTEFE